MNVQDLAVGSKWITRFNSVRQIKEVCVKEDPAVVIYEDDQGLTGSCTLSNWFQQCTKVESKPSYSEKLSDLALNHGTTLTDKGLEFTEAQRKWCENYERETDFDVIFTDSFQNGEMSFAEFRKANLQWYEDHCKEVFQRASYFTEGLTDEDLY